MNKPNKTAHIVDVCAVFFRHYFSSTPVFMNEQGWDVSALMACTRWLCQKQFLESNLVVLAFDESLGTGFRHKLDENYKANRALPSDDVIYQLTLLKDIAQLMGFVVLASEEFEADDLIASSISQLDKHTCVIYSRDKDLQQLLSDSVSLLDFSNNKIRTAESLLDTTGLMPEQIPLYLALMGDASDNIQGVVGVGDKTARGLLIKYKTWAGLLSAIDSGVSLPVRGAERIAKAVFEHKDRVQKNLLLTQLRRDVPVSLTSSLFNQESWQVLNALLTQLNINKALKSPLKLVSEYVV